MLVTPACDAATDDMTGQASSSTVIRWKFVGRESGSGESMRRKAASFAVATTACRIAAEPRPRTTSMRSSRAGRSAASAWTVTAVPWRRAPSAVPTWAIGLYGMASPWTGRNIQSGSTTWRSATPNRPVEESGKAATSNRGCIGSASGRMVHLPAAPTTRALTLKNVQARALPLTLGRLLQGAPQPKGTLLISRDARSPRIAVSCMIGYSPVCRAPVTTCTPFKCKYPPD